MLHVCSYYLLDNQAYSHIEIFIYLNKIAQRYNFRFLLFRDTAGQERFHTITSKIY